MEPTNQYQAGTQPQQVQNPQSYGLSNFNNSLPPVSSKSRRNKIFILSVLTIVVIVFLSVILLNGNSSDSGNTVLLDDRNFSIQIAEGWAFDSTYEPGAENITIERLSSEENSQIATITVTITENIGDVSSNILLSVLQSGKTENINGLTLNEGITLGDNTGQYYELTEVENNISSKTIGLIIDSGTHTYTFISKFEDNSFTDIQSEVADAFRTIVIK